MAKRYFNINSPTDSKEWEGEEGETIVQLARLVLFS